MKTPIPLKSQLSFLRCCLRDWSRYATNRKCARIICCPNRFFSDEKIKAVIRELLLAGGDWEKARMALCNKWEADSIAKLEQFRLKTINQGGQLI